MAFHLNNREAKHELSLYNDGNLLPSCPVHTYLGVKLNRSLTFRHHLQALRKKLSTRVALLRRLAGSGWDAGAKTLRIAALSWSTPPLSTAHQFGVVVRILASLMLWSLSLDACVSHQPRTCLSSQASSQLSSAD